LVRAPSEESEQKQQPILTRVQLNAVQPPWVESCHPDHASPVIWFWRTRREATGIVELGARLDDFERQFDYP